MPKGRARLSERAGRKESAAGSWLTWQLADSALPVGGFAHSSGLEAAWQCGEIRDSQTLIQFLRESLQQAAHTTAPFVAAAHASPRRLEELDELFDAFTPNHVANRASRLQGKALLSLARRVFANELTGTRLTEEPPPEVRGHYAPVFGALCALLKIGAEEALSLMFFMQLRSMISAAVRLNIIGPIEGQAVQWRLAPFAEEVAAGGIVGLDEIAQTSPLLDLWQGTQDRLYSRLFQS